jgi:hypothetical protein
MFVLTLSAGLTIAIATPQSSNDIIGRRHASLLKRDCNENSLEQDREAIRDISEAVGNSVSIPTNTGCVIVDQGLLQEITFGNTAVIQTNIQFCGTPDTYYELSTFYNLFLPINCTKNVFSSTDGTYTITV